MRNQRLMSKKAEKGKKLRRDYERRRNINANVPTDKLVKTREVYGMKLNTKRGGGKYEMKDGKPVLIHAGNKSIVVKVKHYRNHVKGVPYDPLIDKYDRNIGMISYPKRRKFNLKKVTK